MAHIFLKNYGINSIIGSTIIAIICYINFLRNIESITKVNSIIVPLLIAIIIVIGLKNIFKININQIGINTQIDESFLYIIDAIIYSSYNLILVIPVLINLKNFINSKKQIIIISVLTSIIIGVIAILTFLLIVNLDIKGVEMPVVYVIKSKFPEFTYIYGIIILIAIYTTAVSVGISFLNNICKNKKKIPKLALILCSVSILVSPIGFSNLVKFMFPLFGYLGLMQIYFIVKSK